MLRDKEKVDLLAHVLQIYFREEFMKIRPDKRKEVAEKIAKQMVNKINRCGKQHQMNDFSNNIKLLVPNNEECKSFEELVKNILEIRYREPKSIIGKAGDAVRKGAGVTWKGMLDRLGLPIVESDASNINAATGPRM